MPGPSQHAPRHHLLRRSHPESLLQVVIADALEPLLSSGHMTHGSDTLIVEAFDFLHEVVPDRPALGTVEQDRADDDYYYYYI